MAEISLKSITGITSITTPAGVDNQLTLHTNNTTEAVKLDSAGNFHFHNHLNIAGISTAANFKTGTSNLHNTGLNVQDLDVDGHTNLDNVSIAGVVTFTGVTNHNSTIQMLNSNVIRLLNSANSAHTEIRCDGGARFKIMSYNQTMAQFENGQATVFYTDSGQARLTISNSGNVAISGDLDVDGHTNLDNVSIAGVCTATSFVGDGSNLTGITGTTINNNANNRLITGSGTANTLEGEANLTWDGSTLAATGSDAQIRLYDSTASSENSAFRLMAYNGVNYIQSGKAFTSDSKADVIFGSMFGGTEWVRIKTNGRVEINTNGDLYVKGGSYNSTLNGNILSFDRAGYSYIQNSHNSGSLNFRVTSSNTMALRLDNSAQAIFPQGVILLGTQNTSSGHINAYENMSFNIDTDNDDTNRYFSFHKNGMNASGSELMRITEDGDIYGPGGGRKNWFDNGSFDCIGGRRANTSMDYGNHHAYGWVTDRFQSRNANEWSRSTNVPAEKGFSYSTQYTGVGARLVQAVELPDYGDMGVFAPNSYWCVSIWSTAGINQGGQAFSYDLGSTKTGISIVHPSSGGSYQTTGETASGTSTGTFSRYYMVFQMPSSIISGAIAAYWTWSFTAAGYATGWQLERVPTATSKPTPYEHVHPAVTTARCRRYCYQNVDSRLHNGYKRHDSNIHWQERFPVPPTHMPSGSNQGANPYGIHLHDGGLLTNFQSILQNPGVNSASLSEFDYRSGRVIIVGSTSYSPTHVTVPSWESQQYEISHGLF